MQNPLDYQAPESKNSTAIPTALQQLLVGLAVYGIGILAAIVANALGINPLGKDSMFTLLFPLVVPALVGFFILGNTGWGVRWARPLVFLGMLIGVVVAFVVWGVFVLGHIGAGF